MKAAVKALCVLFMSMGSSATAGAVSPSMADPTAFALTPLPLDGAPSLWSGMYGAGMDNWTRGLAGYSQQAFGLKIGGQYTHTFKRRFLSYLAVGGELRAIQWLRHHLDLPPAIDETSNLVGLGELRMFIASRVFDSDLMKMKLKGFRIRAGAFFRATLPTDTTMGSRRRYPLIPWQEVLGTSALDHKVGLIELLGLVGSADYKGKVEVQLSWTPLVLGAVGGGKDRCMTNLHIMISGRPSRYLEMAGELFGLWAYTTPYGTRRLKTEGLGLMFAVPLGRWTASLHFRASMGDQEQSYGWIVMGAGASYRFR